MPDLAPAPGLPRHLNPQQIMALQQKPLRVGSMQRIMPAVLLFYATLLPDEVRFMIGQQTIYAPRAIYLLSLFWVFANLTAARLAFKLADWLILIGAVWIPTSFMLYYGFEEGVIRGTVLGLDIMIPFLVGRLAFTSPNDMRRFLVLVAPGIMIAGFSIVAESMVSHEIVKPAFASIFSPLPAYEGGKIVGVRQAVIDYRYGFLRVGGPFTHPILAGVFMASLVVLYLNAGLRGWPKLTGYLAIPFVFLTVSSSGVFFLLMTAFSVGYDIIQRYVTFLRWKQGLLFIAILLLMMELGSNRGIWGLLGALSFDPQTAFFRQMIWEYGTASVLHHPLIGIGFESYARPAWMITSSVDNYWLSLGIRHGIIVPFALIAALVTVVYTLVRSFPFAKSVVDRRFLFGLAATIGVMGVVEFTFFLFGGMTYWHYLLLGSAYSVALNLIPPRTVKVPPRVMSRR